MMGKFGIVVHTYEEANSNTTITIDGRCNTIYVPGMIGINQLTAIEQWGYTETTNYLFPECTNLSSIASPEKYTFKNVTSFNLGGPSIFYGCTSLTSIPDNMFANCSNVSSRGFTSVFEGCTGITSIGDYAFANCTSVTNFDGLFANCTNLTSIGTHTFEGCTNATSFAGTFEGCTGITSIGDYAFANCSSVTNFDGTFYGCENLTIIGAHAFDGCSSVTSFSSLFTQPTSLGTKMNDTYTVEKCIVVEKEYEVMPILMQLPVAYNTNITSIGDYAFANCTNVTSFESAFEGCTGLTSIGDYAFANCTAVTSFRSTFKGCTNLQSIPEHLFDNTPNVTTFKTTFAGCTSLTGNAISLWERVPDGINNNYNGTPNGLGCYDGCTGLTDYTDIPFYWRMWLE